MTINQLKQMDKKELAIWAFMATVKVIKLMLKDEGFTGLSRLKKAEVIELLMEVVLDGKQPEPPKPKKRKAKAKVEPKVEIEVESEVESTVDTELEILEFDIKKEFRNCYTSKKVMAAYRRGLELQERAKMLGMQAGELDLNELEKAKDKALAEIEKLIQQCRDELNNATTKRELEDASYKMKNAGRKMEAAYLEARNELHDLYRARMAELNPFVGFGEETVHEPSSEQAEPKQEQVIDDHKQPSTPLNKAAMWQEEIARQQKSDMIKTLQLEAGKLHNVWSKELVNRMHDFVDACDENDLNPTKEEYTQAFNEICFRYAQEQEEAFEGEVVDKPSSGDKLKAKKLEQAENASVESYNTKSCPFSGFYGDRKQIKSIYRKWAKVLHPDNGGCTEKFNHLQEKYDTAMRDLESREAHPDGTPLEQALERAANGEDVSYEEMREACLSAFETTEQPEHFHNEVDSNPFG